MDNLEEVSTGGRVTRSLRKRLTSIDSEASSRPGTPLGGKLASTTELNSPARSTRMTRRNSVTGTTPAKTPSKSVVSRASSKLELAEVNSPMRRTTRRRSASITEEEPQPTVKSFPQFDVLTEEDSLEAPITKRQTRSSSKSPLQLTTKGEGKTKSPQSAVKPKRNSKPGPKSKTKQNISDDYNSEVEVIDLETDDLQSSDKKNHSDIAKDLDSSVKEVKADNETPSKYNRTPDTSKFNCLETSNNILEINKTQDNSVTPKKSPKFTKTSSAHRNSLSNKSNMVEKQSEDMKMSEESENDNENNKIDCSEPLENMANNDSPASLITPKVRKSSVVITEVIELESLTPEKMISISTASEQSSKTLSDKTKNRPDKIKMVAFNEYSEDSEAKSVYPKTPGLTKSKSYIDIDSSHEDQENKSFQGNNRSFAEENYEFNEQEEVTKTLTPYKSKLLKTLKSSTPIQTVNTCTTNCNGNDLSPEKILRSGTPYGNSPTSPSKSPKQKKTSIIEENGINSSIKSSKNISITENNDNSNNVSENNEKSNIGKATGSPFARSWHQNVSGTANTSAKLDTIEAEKSSVKSLDDIEIVDTTTGSTKKKHSRFESDDDENIETENNHHEDEIDELDDNEKPYKKHDFIDGEAMEVDDDYQSGDSMDSEERRDIDENEIPVDGESIGTNDTDEEHVEEEGDDDEEDSFIANDSEESLLEYSDYDEGMEHDVKNKEKKKKYARILPAESESEEDKVSSHDGKVQALVLEVSKMIDDTNMFDEEDSNDGGEKQSIVNLNRHSVSITNEKSDKESNVSQAKVLELEESIVDLDVTCPDVSRKTRRKSIINLGCETVENSSQKSNTSLKEKYKSPRKSKNDSIDSVFNRSSRKSISNEGTPSNSNTCNKSTESNMSTSKLSESALQLHEKDAGENTDDDNSIDKESERELNVSRKKIIKKLNQSERFNKTVHELNEDNQETSPEVENVEIDENKSRISTRRSHLNESLRKSICESSHENFNEEWSHEEKHQDNSNEIKNNLSDEDASVKSTENLQELKYESDSADEIHNVSKHPSSPSSISHERIELKTRKRSSLHKLEPEQNIVNNSSASEDSALESHQLSRKQKKKNKAAGLSMSFGCCKTKKQEDTVSGKILHNSFTIGVSVTKKSNMEQVHLNSSNSSDVNAHVENSKSESTSSADRISSEDEEQLNKLQHVQKVGNHMTQLIRRQSLANIAESKDDGKLDRCKSNRRSICIPDSSDFNPSQSFIDNVSDRKKEFDKQSAKRKRLSKSFCAGSLDTTEVEIEERHLHKKSKLIQNKPTKSNPENDNDGNDDNNNIQRILGRCEQILEAANRAKLEEKQNYNKSKVKISKKKQLKKVEKSEEKLEQIKEEEVVTKEKQEKRKAEIEKALKASVGIILNNPKNKEKPESTQVTKNLESKRLPKDILDVIAVGEPVLKKKKLKNQMAYSDMDRENIQKIHKFKTAAGEVTEMEIQKKKKVHKTKIELSTGTVKIEPITPKKERIQNGFYESPNTPIGFKVRKILTAGQDTPPMAPSHKGIKRKLIIEEPEHCLPKPQWTQSGKFIEEELYPRSKKSKKSVTVVQARSAVNNSAMQFKKTALYRDNIPRETTTELLQRKERKLIHKHF